MSAYGDNWKYNFSDGYQPGDILASLFGVHNTGIFAGSNAAKEQLMNGGLGYISSGNSGSSILDDITGQTNTKMQNTAAAELQEDSQNFQREVLQNSIQWKMEDLKKAGLNPVMAVNNGGSSASAGIASTQASNVNALASLGTAAAGIGILLKALKAVK
jgi:hypothetical protein